MKKEGFKSFGFHTYDENSSKIMKALGDERHTFSAFALTAVEGGLSKSDPETAARQHLQLILASSAVPEMNSPANAEKNSEFRSLGTETIPLTGTKTVKFRQTFDRIPVYGSLVTIEMDEDNELLAVNSSIGSPEGVDGIAKMSPSEIIALVRKDSGCQADSFNSTPQLIYYFDSKPKKWHLAFMVEDVPQMNGSDKEPQAQQAMLMDYFVDAHTGAIIAKRPRTPNAAQSVVLHNINDDLAQPRQIRCMSDNQKSHLYDDVLNVHTFDFDFQDLDASFNSLPGRYITNPPNPWSGAAVSAHANAAAVADFLRNALKRNGIDNSGGSLVSTVNCISAKYSPDGEQWNNAAWYRGQMVYGQKKVNGKLRSYAVGIDVVAHEIFHGITENTARLEYAAQTGALNESYSDIFGLIVSNYSEKDVSKWNWQMGEDLNAAGVPLRDFQNPALYDQPAHMDDYKKLPVTAKGDWGGVHINSGIHNFAAYKIMTAQDSQKKYLFSADSLAALFYLALTQYLTRNSDFAASRRAVEIVARTLFRNDPVKLNEAKLKAISSAYDAVGIA